MTVLRAGFGSSTFTWLPANVAKWFRAPFPDGEYLVTYEIAGAIRPSAEPCTFGLYMDLNGSQAVASLEPFENVGGVREFGAGTPDRISLATRVWCTGGEGLTVAGYVEQMPADRPGERVLCEVGVGSLMLNAFASPPEIPLSLVPQKVVKK